MKWFVVLLPFVFLTIVIACSSSEGDGPAYKPDATVTGSPTTLLPTATALAAQDRATLLGSLSVDGQPLEADYLGANVIHDGGLINACQASLVAVRGGRYEIEIKGDAETKGCGAPGAQIVLWTSLGNGLIYSKETLPWPGRGQTPFGATFSTREPQGARPSSTDFFGHVTDKNGTPLGEDTVVEAYIGDTLCGIGTVYDYSGDVGFVLGVAGPERPGCAKDGTITFRVGDAQAVQTAVNDLTGGDDNRNLELTLTG